MTKLSKKIELMHSQLKKFEKKCKGRKKYTIVVDNKCVFTSISGDPDKIAQTVSAYLGETVFSKLEIGVRGNKSNVQYVVRYLNTDPDAYEHYELQGKYDTDFLAIDNNGATAEIS